ncbi:MAG: lantibiotic dehydratase [Pyrinomonadaceae bacterium]
MSTTERATNVTAATVGEQAAANHLAPHLLPLEEGQWAVWRLTGLRGAGFPASMVLRLAAPECAAAADRLAEAEAEAERARLRASESIKLALTDIRSRGEWEQSPALNPLLRALKRVKAGAPPQAPTGDAAADDALGEWRAATARAAAAQADYVRSYADATALNSEALREIIADDSFREAVIWQNRHAVNRIAQSLGKGAGARNSSQRKTEELITNYLQRYCVKNDTIGFFGPVGWAYFVPAGESLVVRPGEHFLAARSVFFEGWSVDTVAEVLNSDGAMRPWLAPRRLPFIGLDGGVMTLPGGASLPLPAKDAAVLAACDGRRTAKELAAELLGAGVGGLGTEEEVYRLLETYCKRGVLAWKLEVPVQQRGDLTLRGLIEKVGDERLRRRGLDLLDELEAARGRVSSAAGDPERLNRELNHLEETFSRLTGAPATRAAGQTYAARTLAYEDCRRDIEVQIGPEVFAALAPPLSLLLRSARWISHELAGMYRVAFRAAYAELAAKRRSPVVPAADFWIKCDPLMFKEGVQIADRVAPLFQQRWAEVLALEPGVRRAAFTYEQLRPRVEAAFAAPAPGWSHARYHSPDVMIAAESVEAVRRGDFSLVIGEIHLGVNSLNSNLFIGQHPRPEEICDAITADFAGPRIVPVPPRSWPSLTARTVFEFIPPANYRLMVSSDACGVPPSRALPISDLVVEDQGGELVLRTRDGRLRFEVVEGFGEFLSSLIVNFLQPLPPSRHTPRFTIDRVVVSRESWRFPPAELAFAHEADEAARFAAARRWQRAHGLPRFLFAKTPVERKPFYVDMESPALVNIFARHVRRATEAGGVDSLITFSEMLPTQEDLWLPDAEGRRYTSELRMVALDLSPSPRDQQAAAVLQK